MCLIVSEEDQQLTVNERNIIDTFKDFTGINCEAFIINDEHSIGCAHGSSKYCDYICYRSAGQHKRNFNKMLQFNRIFGKPYIFNCYGVLYLWASFVELQNNNKIIFIGGPARAFKSKEQIDQIQTSIDIPNLDETYAGFKDIMKFPYMSLLNIESAAQLLHDIVQFKYQTTSDEFFRKKAHNHNFKNYRNPPENIIETPKDRNNIMQSLDFLDNNIQGIIQSALTGDFAHANLCFEMLISSMDDIKDDESMLAYIIGVISLLGQTIAKSMDYIYSDEVFFLYKTFLNDLKKTNDKINIKHLAQCYFNSIFKELCTSCNKNIKNSPQINRIIEYVKKNYERDISITTISSELFLDPSYMCRVFKKETGITIKNFIKDYRLMIAADKIRNTKENIEKIARNAGFQNIVLFRRAFKDHYSLSPSEYRSILKLQN